MTTTRIDSHVHVWDPDRADYPWLGPDLAPIDQAMPFERLTSDLENAGFERAVLVQSGDNPEDTDYMLEIARGHDAVVGVVAYAALHRPDELEEAVATLRREPLVRGVRNLVHMRSDPDWMLRQDVDRSLGVLERNALTFDLVTNRPRHLELVPTLARRHPGLRIVIDHLGTPPIGLEDREPWWSLLRAAAAEPNVFSKISGLYPEHDRLDWTTNSVRPFVEYALDVFGPARLMYGGDWPISVLAGGYSRVWRGVRPLFEDLDAHSRDRVLGLTAAEVYGLTL